MMWTDPALAKTASLVQPEGEEASLSRKILLLSILPILALTTVSIAADDMGLYGWLEIAPDVVSGTAGEQDGRYTLFRIDRVLRGDASSGEQVLIDLKYANRHRDYDVDPRPLRLVAGTGYVILLQKAPPAKRRDLPVYHVVRGPRGARELPAEGSQAILEAMERFVLIQQMGDDRARWRLLGALLEETNPILLESSLGQFLKFRRGDVEMLPAIMPLLDHPASEIRASSCELIGQIVLRYGPSEIEAEAELLSAVAARARRDEVVEVRLAATEALGTFTGMETTEILEEIASEDADQRVRYTAETILLDRRSAIDFQKGAAYDRAAATM
jgi:hypothetical protein